MSRFHILCSTSKSVFISSPPHPIWYSVLPFWTIHPSHLCRKINGFRVDVMPAVELYRTMAAAEVVDLLSVVCNQHVVVFDFLSAVSCIAWTWTWFSSSSMLMLYEYDSKRVNQITIGSPIAPLNIAPRFIGSWLEEDRGGGEGEGRGTKFDVEDRKKRLQQS